LANAGIADADQPRPAIFVRAALPGRETDPVTDELPRGATELFAVARPIATGIITTGCARRAAGWAALGAPIWTNTGVAIPGLAAGATDRFGCRRWATSGIGVRDAAGAGKRDDCGRGPF